LALGGAGCHAVFSEKGAYADRRVNTPGDILTGALGLSCFWDSLEPRSSPVIKLKYCT